MAGNGQILSRIAYGADSSSLPPFSKSTADVVIVPESTITAAHTYVLDTTDAQAGSTITFKKDTTGFDITVRQTGGALIGVLSTTPTAGYRWFDLIFTTKWELLRFQVA